MHLRRTSILVLGLLAFAGTATAGQQSAYVINNGKHLQRPAKLWHHAPGVSVEVVGLRWSKWGSPVAIGRGTYRVCPNGSRCLSTGGLVQLDRLTRYGCGESVVRVYRRARVSEPGAQAMAFPAPAPRGCDKL